MTSKPFQMPIAVIQLLTKTIFSQFPSSTNLVLKNCFDRRDQSNFLKPNSLQPHKESANLFFVSDPLVPFLLVGPPFFPIMFFCPPPVNRDDRQLLAHAMASDFTVAWQFSQREQYINIFMLAYK
jgi:hypothetical protein